MVLGNRSFTLNLTDKKTWRGENHGRIATFCYRLWFLAVTDGVLIQLVDYAGEWLADSDFMRGYRFSCLIVSAGAVFVGGSIAILLSSGVVVRFFSY